MCGVTTDHSLMFSPGGSCTACFMLPVPSVANVFLEYSDSSERLPALCAFNGFKVALLLNRFISSSSSGSSSSRSRSRSSSSSTHSATQLPACSVEAVAVRGGDRSG